MFVFVKMWQEQKLKVAHELQLNKSFVIFHYYYHYYDDYDLYVESNADERK